jgi:hypothetical protein
VLFRSTQSFADWPIYGDSLDFKWSTFSQHGIDIIEPSDNITFGTNFETVVDGFNSALGPFGYVYYQTRTTTSPDWGAYIMLATYYNDLTTSADQSYVLRYRLSDGALVETDTLLIDSSGLTLGTNSTSGGTTITESYYP